MNITEERDKLQKELEALTHKLASLTLQISVNKSRIKKLDKLIEQANEVLK